MTNTHNARMSFYQSMSCTCLGQAWVISQRAPVYCRGVPVCQEDAWKLFWKEPHSCHIIVCMYKLHVLHFRWWQMYSRSGLHTFIKSQKIIVWHKFLSRVIYHYIPLHLKKVLETRWLSLEAYKKLLGKLLCVAQFKCSCIDSFLSRTFEFMFIILSLMNSARNVFLDFFSPPAVQWARQQGSGC